MPPRTMPDVDRPLRGRRVLITRPQDRGRGLADAVERLGGTADLRPTIAFATPADPGPSLRAARNLGSYDWVVVTSPTGARFLLDAIEGRPEDLAGTRFAAVGPGTARALAGAGIDPAVVASRANAEGLALDLVPRIAAGERVLVVRPEVARPILPDTLRDHGAVVEPVVFYRTVAAPGCAAIARALIDGGYDIVVFSSPSTLLRLLEDDGHPRDEVLAALAGTRRVAIGDVTANAMDEHGIPPHAVARAPTESGVLEAIQACL